jgi:hypothetical protein
MSKTILKYRKIPTEHDVMFFNGTNGKDIEKWSKGKVIDKEDHLEIETLEGTMNGSKGDWIIKGLNKEFWAIKPDIFEKSYEEVKDEIEEDFTTTAPTSQATGQFAFHMGIQRRNQIADKVQKILRNK